MGIVLSQSLKQNQKLSLTPSLKKSIDLLQLSRYELVHKIHQEIDDNPFIEKIEEYETSSSIDDDFNFEFSSRQSLRESLLEQIDDYGLDGHSRKICILIIENINEMGGLDLELEELEKISNYKFKLKEIESLLLNIIHKLTPTGIGFRNHKECIILQLESQNLSKKLFSVCSNIVFNDFLDDLDKIKNNLVKSDEDLSLFNLALKEIKKCDLSPGLNFEETRYIYPDLRIVNDGSSSKIKFIENDFPKIQIDENLTNNIKKDLKKNKNPKISEKIAAARWLLTSIKKRNETVLKVGEYIFSKQVNFFKDNPIKIETLTNKEISEKLNIHPSTVSRILRNKYAETPKGIISLKSLMMPSVSKSRNITSVQLMKLIEEIIKFEKKPKSDKQITVELNKRGFNLARRTISKYRKKNNIPSSRYR